MTVSATARTPLLGLPLPADFVMDRVLVEHDLRILGKAEQIPDALLEEERAKISSRGLRTCAVAGPDPGFFVLYYAKDQAILDRAESLERAQRVRHDELSRQSAATELGGLLGYPSCCVREFTTASSHRDQDIFSARGGGLQNPASPLANFFLRDVAPMGFVPCKLNCSAALDRAKSILETVCATHSINPHRYLSSLQSVVFWFSGPFFVEFLGPHSITADGFSYQGVSSSVERCRLFKEHLAHPLAVETLRWQNLLQTTNRLELSPTSMVVYNGEQRIALHPRPTHPHGWFAFVNEEIDS